MALPSTTFPHGRALSIPPWGTYQMAMPELRIHTWGIEPAGKMSRLLTPESLLRAETQQLLKTYRTKEYALYPNWYSTYSLIRLTVMLLPQCKKDFSIKFLYIDFVSFFSHRRIGRTYSVVPPLWHRFYIIPLSFWMKRQWSEKSPVKWAYCEISHLRSRWQVCHSDDRKGGRISVQTTVTRDSCANASEW